MMKFLLSKHSRSIFIFALLSLFLCMAAGKASAAGLNPVVKIDKTSYTSSGTEVTLRLWMFNWKYAVPNTKKYNARFTGDVSLYIDDKEVGKLNSMWGLISGSSYTFLKDTPGTVGKSSGINLDGTNVGTAQLQDFKSGQTYPYNSNTTDKSWSTVDLKLSFNKSFSYYGHKITVKGKWQDQGSGSLVTKDVVLDNIINGFVRPINLKAQPSGGNMVFSWEQEGYNPSASTLGKWIVYKREGDNNVKLGEAAANEHSLSIEKKLYSCSNGYIMTFLPNVCKGEETVCGLTTSLAATGHKPNADDICQICGHSFFRYHTSDGNIVDISGRDFGANVVSHKVVDGECVIEFDAPITQIPQAAFFYKNLVGELRIPNTVTSIQIKAFYSCTGLTGNLVIPNSVKEIGGDAFNSCRGFNGTLTLSSNLKTIGGSAFYGCSGFTGSLTLPNSVTTIGNAAFRACGSFTNLELSNALSVIPYQAFWGCTSLSGNLVIPNSVKEIGICAFYECSGFNGSLTLSNNLKVIEERVFSGCSGFTGDLIIPNSVRTIGYGAFNQCSGFTGKLTIPNSVTTIGKMAFYECSGFTGDLTIPNSVTTIETSTFQYCTGFKGKLTIPNSVTTIGENAFDECSGFTGNLTIPNSVTTIGHLAFGACSGFTGDVSLPKSLEILGSTSFKACKKIKTIKFQSLPTVLKGSLDDYKAIVSLSDDSYISPEVSGTVNEISYTRQISNNWGTLVLPYPLKLTGSEPYRLYNIETVSDDELVLKQIDGEVAAGTPCVVKRNGSESELTFGANDAELNMTIDGKTVGNMTFNGTYWAKEVTNGYVIAKDCFWNVAELNKSDLVKGVKVKPFRAWLDGTSPNGASQLSICVSDTATGIGAAGTIGALNDTATEYYDLSGKRLDEPQKGVNIVRMKSGKTKKIIIK
ncbi:leucine-rich repeat domain-containing protein [uncultured Prevotella sp.]|uniref:leucine-rich repeat domain-containing protein n=1 Tax=uncultured Prevotella sp. TaxID=159272 RepID=UPI0027E3392D|nr:leucine-rich repeat domain-containing protein [uncultured Prevotella sp.]